MHSDGGRLNMSSDGEFEMCSGEDEDEDLDIVLNEEDYSGSG